MRLYKTRAIATEACKKGRIKMDNQEVKPSRIVHVGETFSVRKGAITRTYKILQLNENRVGAKIVADFLQDITPPEHLEAIEIAALVGYVGRDRGTGRPTKKERREIDAFMQAEWDDELDEEI